MTRFLIDEDLPRSLVRLLIGRGYQAVASRDVGLRGKPDGEVLHYAVVHDMALLTRDVGLVNLLLYPLQSHKGVVLARFTQEIATPALNLLIAAGIDSIRNDNLQSALEILEPGRGRIRRVPA
jgi:predicted nuclease of predicted toxin-antitoxin system